MSEFCAQVMERERDAEKMLDTLTLCIHNSSLTVYNKIKL